MAVYEFALLITSAAILGAVVLPRLLADKPMSFPLIYVVAGYVVFTLPLGFPAPNPIENPGIAEHLTELVVIVALMGAEFRQSLRELPVCERIGCWQPYREPEHEHPEPNVDDRKREGAMIEYPR